MSCTQYMHVFIYEGRGPEVQLDIWVGYMRGSRFTVFGPREDVTGHGLRDRCSPVLVKLAVNTEIPTPRPPGLQFPRCRVRPRDLCFWKVPQVIVMVSQFGDGLTYQCLPSQMGVHTEAQRGGCAHLSHWPSRPLCTAAIWRKFKLWQVPLGRYSIFHCYLHKNPDKPIRLLMTTAS